MEADRLLAFPGSCEAAFSPLAVIGVLAADQKGITRLRLALRAIAKGNVVSLCSARTPDQQDRKPIVTSACWSTCPQYLSRSLTTTQKRHFSFDLDCINRRIRQSTKLEDWRVSHSEQIKYLVDRITDTFELRNRLLASLKNRAI